MGRPSMRRFISRSARPAIVVAVLCLGSVTASLAADRGQQLAFGVDMAKRGLWAEALFRFQRADREDPGNPKILNNLAVSYEAVGQFDKALELYRQAVKLDPNNADLKRNYARFVEFYQSFRPKEESEQDDGKAGEAPEPSAASDQPPDGR